MIPLTLDRQAPQDGPIIIITRHSLVKAKGEVFVLLLRFCSFFVNDFSTTRGPIHAKFCMRA